MLLPRWSASLHCKSIVVRTQKGVFLKQRAPTIAERDTRLQITRLQSFCCGICLFFRTSFSIRTFSVLKEKELIKWSKRLWYERESTLGTFPKRWPQWMPWNCKSSKSLVQIGKRINLAILVCWMVSASKHSLCMSLDKLNCDSSMRNRFSFHASSQNGKNYKHEHFLD